MKKILSKVLQSLADFVVGIAIYFSLHAFAPDWGDSAIAIITLIITALFAELVEMKMKK